VKGNRRKLSLRIWTGCNLTAWLSLLARNRFALERPFWLLAVVVTFVSLLHSLLGLVERFVFGLAVAHVRISQAPLFIIGHWRTGTTLLHELLILDERHSYPTTYECFAPHHFLLTEGFVTRWLGSLVPSLRPMDNMPAGWDRPQEDEFALCMMGLPSPYLTVAFPNGPAQFTEYLDLEDVPPRALATWKAAYDKYLRRVTLKRPGRLILKSPPHSCRIKVLLELFPNARFVHIVRDPYIVFPSTVTLWKTLYRWHGLQSPTFDGLEELVFATFTRLYERLEEDRKLVAAGRYCELRYEDLVADPVGQMRTLYDCLELGEFERALPRIREYAEKAAGYRTNSYALSGQTLRAIRERWEKVIRQYGYAKEAGPRIG
jgi:hypothetical protein